MIRTLKIEINCGEKTCVGREPCKYFIYEWGLPICKLFNTELDYDYDGEFDDSYGDEFAIRCKTCIDLEVKNA